jgi:hypothetical protein
MARVEMWEAMIIEEHRDRDPEEAAYGRHEFIMARAAAVVLLGFSSSFVPNPFPSESPSIGFGLVVPRRGAGVVERGSLENCWRRKALVGSNPTPSASGQVKIPYWNFQA